MSDYSAAISWVIILGCLFVVGLLYMMLNPLVNTFFALGYANPIGADPYTMQILHDMWTTWVPVSVIFGAVVYGWRKSNNRVM